MIERTWIEYQSNEVHKSNTTIILKHKPLHNNGCSVHCVEAATQHYKAYNSCTVKQFIPHIISTISRYNLNESIKLFVIKCTNLICNI